MSVFGVILVRIFSHSDQNNSKYGHFSRSVFLSHIMSCSDFPYMFSLVFLEIINIKVHINRNRNRENPAPSKQGYNVVVESQKLIYTEGPSTKNFLAFKKILNNHTFIKKIGQKDFFMETTKNRIITNNFFVWNYWNFFLQIKDGFLRTKQAWKSSMS